VGTVAVIITTFGGALSATLGVLVGGVVTRRVQERHWLRDKQLRAYEELFSQYARFMMALRRAHLDRTPVDVDWGAWSVSLTSASLVAPLGVARAIDAFGSARSHPENSTTNPRYGRPARSFASTNRTTSHIVARDRSAASSGRSGRPGPLPSHEQKIMPEATASPTETPLSRDEVDLKPG
jgi:hypothetical protein